MKDKITQAAEWIKDSNHTTVFTGAGVSVESGIPPFRGEKGIWNKYDPQLLDLDYFRSHPDKSWVAIREIFYDYMGKIKPNPAHVGVARLEQEGYVKAVVTQNIDNLHQEAGSRNVYEFHGTAASSSCMSCGASYKSAETPVDTIPPRCNACSGILKPDFIFFGEAIPKQAAFQSFYEAQIADVFLVIGTTGEVMPACQVPVEAKQNGAKIIEINPETSNYTHTITDIYLQGKAGEIVTRLVDEIIKK